MEEFVNPFNLTGKKILVVGASSGIGKASALLASNLGARVFGVGRDSERLNELGTQLIEQGGEVIQCDITNEDEVGRLIDALPIIDGILMSAGKGLTLPVQFSSKEYFEDLFNVNFFSSVELLRLLYKKKKINKGGSIVVIASMGGTHVFSGSNSIYGASKAALDSFMKFAAKEFSPRKIRVNTICPGMVDTPLIHRGTVTDEQLAENAKTYPLKRYGTPEDIANSAIFLLSDASSWITGTSMIVDGGLSIK